MSHDSFETIAYMPYAPLEGSFQIGEYEVWPFHKECNVRISKHQLLDHLNRLFGRYFERKFDRKKGGYDKPLQEVFVISPVCFNGTTADMTEEQLEEIRDIAHIIAFCAINELAFASSSADAFVLHTYSFSPGSNMVRLWDKGFADVAMVKITKPYYVSDSLSKFHKTPLSDALATALQLKHKEPVRRIFRTLELFYHTATHAEMITGEHRILSLVMCFEVLLNFKGEKRRFANKIEQDIANNSPHKETRLVQGRQGTTQLEHSQTGWWAYDLYDLRSDIVHGKAVDWKLQKYGGVSTRIEFGGILLRKLVKRVLTEQGLWPPDSDQDVLGDAILEAEALDQLLAQKVSDFQQRSPR